MSHSTSRTAALCGGLLLAVLTGCGTAPADKGASDTPTEAAAQRRGAGGG
ncbi:hypothetical protein JGS43_40245, partial [Streptomyces sp. P01-F02]|nr:hypothetical protein [Streptomyces poriferorum]